MSKFHVQMGFEETREIISDCKTYIYYDPSLEAPQRGASNEGAQYMIFVEK